MYGFLGWLSYFNKFVSRPGFKRSLLIRRSQTSPEELRAYICFAAVGTPKQKLIEIAGSRWTIETCFKESKSEVGLDQYEVRSYDGWYKHITLACIALAFLTVLSCRSLDTKSIQNHNPASSTLEEFKRGRNLRVWARVTLPFLLISFTELHIGSLVLWIIWFIGWVGGDYTKLLPCGGITVNQSNYNCNIRSCVHRIAKRWFSKLCNGYMIANKRWL